MRLLQRSNAGEICLTKAFVGDDTPPYAILSHTWGPEEEEVSYKDLVDGTEKDKTGFEKIRFCGNQAARDGFQYFWVDTCCIDKSSSAVLQEAINSMFHWYRRSAKCYVYLADVATKEPSAGISSSDYTWESALRSSRWFTRGWTLQELLAPGSVVFYSREWNRLGDKRSLELLISTVTRIPIEALRGSPLPNFTVPQRMAWMENRNTTRAEDKAYALLGVFDVQIPLLYGEGESKAFRRLREEIDKATGPCLADLRTTDPCSDKKRIESTKGGLLRDSYCWILDNAEFKAWRDEEQSRFLWVKGDPGKGKTMLLCGIIDELTPLTKLGGDPDGPFLSYFFCQATDSRINSATAVLRGLIYLLVKQRPSLISHIQSEYNSAGKQLFEDANAWVALTGIFTSILKELNQVTYILVDALDECRTPEDLSQLLDFIVCNSALPSVKWIISSRNWRSIEEQLNTSTQGLRLSLELNETFISAAVGIYIQHKVHNLARLKMYNSETKTAVYQHLLSNAHGTFLWVAVVCDALLRIPPRKAQKKITEFPPGLNALYQRMMDQVCNLDDPEDVVLCKKILAVASVVYAPITLDELASLVEIPDCISSDYEAQEIIELCGSFLTLQERTIFFVHQSAKDFLLEKASAEIFPRGTEQTHHAIFSQSLHIMSKILQSNIYSLTSPAFSIDQVIPPKPDPLAPAKYSCVYWVEHLHLCGPSLSHEIQDGGTVDIFLRNSYLHWLEALSLLTSIPHGVRLMAKLEGLLKPQTSLAELVRDERRFIQRHKLALEYSPLHVYTSLVFSPTRSITRKLFQQEEPDWILTKPTIEDKWSNCTQTLEGHRNIVRDLALSPDGRTLASASWDRTIKLWDTASGACTKTLEDNSSPSDNVVAVRFSPGGHLASVSNNFSNSYTVNLWDVATGACLQTFEDDRRYFIDIAFSPNGSVLAVASDDFIVEVWDTASGSYARTPLSDGYDVLAFVSLPETLALASTSKDGEIKLWDMASGACTRTLVGHTSHVKSLACSPDGTLTSGSADYTIKLWDMASGTCIRTLEGHDSSVDLVVYSPNGTLASISQHHSLTSPFNDSTIKLWNTSSGVCTQTLYVDWRSSSGITFLSDGHTLALGSENTIKLLDTADTSEGCRDFVQDIVSSPNGRILASTHRSAVRLWDVTSGVCAQTLGDDGPGLSTVAFSPDSHMLATVYRKTTKLWDVASGICIHTLNDHDFVSAIVFSYDGRMVASASTGIRLWDTDSGACIRILQDAGYSISRLAFSSDGRILASEFFRTIKIWDIATGTCQTLDSHRQSVTVITFSPDSHTLASASEADDCEKCTIRLWDTASWACTQTLLGHDGAWVLAIVFSPDGKTLASAATDSTIRLWNVANGACSQTLDIGRTLRHLAFDPTGSCLYTDLGGIPLGSNLKDFPTAKTAQQPRYRGYGLSTNTAWITWNGENVIWLPPEYRRGMISGGCRSLVGSSCSTVAIGLRSGQVVVVGLATTGPVA